VVASFGTGLHIVDVSIPTEPVGLAVHQMPGGANDLLVADDILYATDDFIGLRIFDVRRPTDPVEIARMDLTADIVYRGISTGHGPMAVDGDLLFVGDYYGRLHIIDIADPAHPLVRGRVRFDLAPVGLTLFGDQVLMTGDKSVVKIVDVGDPDAPVVVGSLDERLYGRSIAVTSDGYAFVVAYFSSRVRVVDVRNPAAPVEIGEIALDDHPHAVQVAGDHAFFAAGGGGLLIIDVSSPVDPVEVAVVEDPIGPVFDIALTEDYAFLADIRTGNPVVDIRDPEHPVMACIRSDDRLDGRRIAVDDDCTYLDSGHRGFAVLCTRRVFERDGVDDRRQDTTGHLVR
jgi:hypothetical protein